MSAKGSFLFRSPHRYLRRHILSYLNACDTQAIALAHGAKTVNMNKFALLCVRYGHFNLFKWALAHGAKLYLRHVRCIAAQYGKMHMLEALDGFELSKKDKFSICLAAAKGGQLSLVQDYLSCSEQICLILETAALHGHVHILKWACVESSFEEYDAYFFNTHLVECAARGGHLECFKWCCEFPNVFEIHSKTLLKTIIMKGHVLLFEWIITHFGRGYIERETGFILRCLTLSDQPKMIDYVSQHFPDMVKQFRINEYSPHVYTMPQKRAKSRLLKKQKSLFL